MENPIKFGTDGWRGIIARDFTFDNVARCAQGVAEYLKRNNLASKGLVIGYDTRFASEDFARVCAEVLCANGVKVYLCPSTTPTPAISYGVIVKKAAGGIVLTASHNPSVWNGFKFKTSDGASASEEVVSELEKLIAASFTPGAVKRVTAEKAASQGLLEEFDIMPPYLARLEELVDLKELRRAKIRAVADPMFGAGMGYLKKILDGGTIEVSEVNGERNPSFPGMKQPEPVAANLKKLSSAVRRRKAVVGIATDGDADRVGIVDEQGTFMTTLQTFALLCYYLLEVCGERGTIVKTITNTSMAYRLGKIFGVPVKETKVGFKYVAPVMLSENALIGGEESGGYGFRGHVPERDGILAGLYFLDLIHRTGKKPSQLLADLHRMVGPHYFRRIDLEFPAEKRQEIVKNVQASAPKELEGSPVVKVDTFDGTRFTAEDGSWLLIRFSGTEPLLRTYSESSSPERVERLLALARKVAGLE